MKNLLIAVTGLACVAGSVISHAQTAQSTFEVASIKVHPPTDGPQRVSMAGEHGRINYSNVTVRALVRKAYGLRVYPLATGADPLSTDRYDVIAKASGEPSDKETMQMLQALLEERFGLKAHRETKELPIYALIVGKNIAKLHEMKDDGTAAEITGDGARGRPITAHHVTMKMLAGALQGYTGDPVLDMTGLTGIYDLSLEFTWNESPAGSDGPSIFTAVQEQLGLKLEARKGPVEVIVIDHVGKPSGN